MLQGGFSNGHFVFTSDIFDINKQGVVSLKTDATLDRETKASYLLQVENHTSHRITLLFLLTPKYSKDSWG